MGRVQGGARAAFATPSWGPARMTYFLHSKKTVANRKYSVMDFLSMISICFFGALFKKEDKFRMVMGINRV